MSRFRSKSRPRLLERARRRRRTPARTSRPPRRGSSRPFEMTSSVPSALAATVGLRSGSTSTPVPSLIAAGPRRDRASACRPRRGWGRTAPRRGSRGPTPTATRSRAPRRAARRRRARRCRGLARPDEVLDGESEVASRAASLTCRRNRRARGRAPASIASSSSVGGSVTVDPRRLDRAGSRCSRAPCRPRRPDASPRSACACCPGRSRGCRAWSTTRETPPKSRPAARREPSPLSHAGLVTEVDALGRTAASRAP